MTVDPLTSMFGVFFGFIWLLWFICMGLVVAGFVFWIIMLIDVVGRKFSKDDDKIIWVLVVVLAGIIGALVYYFVVKKKDKKRK